MHGSVRVRVVEHRAQHVSRRHVRALRAVPHALGFFERRRAREVVAVGLAAAALDVAHRLLVKIGHGAQRRLAPRNGAKVGGSARERRLRLEGRPR
eukprot:5217413-Pleurochrysis_carterae.AAC.1